MFRFLGAAALLLAVGCAQVHDAQLAGALSTAIEQAGYARKPLAIADVTDFAWDRFHVFEPYTPVSDIDKQLGFAWPDAKETGIDYLDGIDLLVFVKDKRVVRSVVLPRKDGDFATMKYPIGLSPAQAVFDVRRDRHTPTWWELVLTRPRR